MDLMKRTKAELVQTIESQKTTIEARDKRINELLDENKGLYNTSSSSVTKQVSEVRSKYMKEISDLKEKHSQEIKSLKGLIEVKEKEVERFKSASEVVDPKDVAKLQSELQACKKLLEERSKMFSKYISQYGNLLKIMSGTLGQAIDLNEYMEKDVK